MRIGHGFDVHAFGPGDHLVLGGVRVDHDRGLRAHSDGDVVVHALCDALLGAIAAGDIGQHFPDTDERWRGADSRELLRSVMDKVSSAGFGVANADLTVVAERPRLAGHLPAMGANLAADLQIAVGQINLKATTSEGLGAIGRGEGIAAHAVVLLLAR
ncbi:MAG: 2-C-methyl-D-erythritol 2,4-cyclodiphosphate synthase [Gammaproteobacteria bacterium]